MKPEPSEYYNIYLKRLNRYGFDYKTRTQNKRERDFEDYLLKSVYRIDFDYLDEARPGIFEKYKQDETETLHYLLTRTSLNIPNGTILMLPNKDEELKPWMIYYLEAIKASGYNRYVVLKMSHYLTWKDREGITRNSWAYLYGQQDNMLKDELQSRSRSDARYTEPLKTSNFILPTNEFLRKDDYLEVGDGALKEGYKVTGYDIQSSPGVEYVTIDPVYLYDMSPAPARQEEDSEEDFYWLEGGC